MHTTKIPVLITNRTATLTRYRETAGHYLDALRKHWSYEVPSYRFMLRSRPWYRKCKECGSYKNHKDADHIYVPVWDGKKNMMVGDSVPAGLFWATYKEIEEKEHIKFKIKFYPDVTKVQSTRQWLVSDGKYAFQNECADKVTQVISEGKGGLVLSATGSGKTRVSAMIASRLDCDILFVVDQLVLLKQAQAEISKHLGEKVGYVGESKFHLERVTIATIQTLALHKEDRKFKKWFKRVAVIIIDELHDQLNSSNFSVMNAAKPLSVIGLTATLGLTKKEVRLRAYALTGPVIYQFPVAKGMEEGVLSKGICVRLKYENSLPDIKNEKQSHVYNKRVVENSERNHIICSLARRAVKEGKYVIIGVERLAHLSKISARLDRYKVKHKVVSGTFRGQGIDADTRIQHKNKFEVGKVRCLVVNKVFGKGVDIRRVDVIINGSARPSANNVLQFFGRGLRTHLDKTGLLYFDISDTDRYDSSRTKKNWLHTASKRRIRALKKAGITIKELSTETNSSQILKQSEKWLHKEINK